MRLASGRREMDLIPRSLAPFLLLHLDSGGFIMTWDQVKGVANELRDSAWESWARMTGGGYDMMVGGLETLEEQMAAFERLWV